MSAIVPSSGLVRAPILTDTPYPGKFHVGSLGRKSGRRVSRATIAQFILDETDACRFLPRRRKHEGVHKYRSEANALGERPKAFERFVGTAEILGALGSWAVFSFAAMRALPRGRSEVCCSSGKHTSTMVNPRRITNTTAKRSKVLWVNRAWGKGRSICIAFCSKDVLAFDAEEKVVIARIESCTYCGLCELRCPDFAFTLRGRPVRARYLPAAAEPRQGSSEL